MFEILAGPDLWTPADYITGPTFLEIEVVDADGVWQYAPDQYCKAGGTVRNDLAAILPAAPIGALIGKMGGSSADFPPPPGAGGPSALPIGIRVFALEAFAIINVSANDSGQLYLTMNDILAGFPNHGGKMKVKVSTGV